MAAQPAALVTTSNLLKLQPVGTVLGKTAAANKIVNLLYFSSKGLAELVGEEEPEAAGALFNFSKSASKSMAVLNIGAFAENAVDVFKRPTFIGKSAAAVSTVLNLNATLGAITAGKMSASLPETQLCIALQTRSLISEVFKTPRIPADIAISFLDLTSLGAFRLPPALESAAGCASALLWLTTEIKKEGEKETDSKK
eukprot:TRINITY_DN29039_c0_g1_i1.p2 TRINITY_DN29039_c0_g1~~TRINITY_DN29039_c0_g1_i1.p2  ORF type:complete len:198 (+),score=35.41 TRINITY_DN29039_c0_g1_i1:61-654(+)